MNTALLVVAAVGAAVIVAAASVFVVKKLKFLRLPSEVRDGVLGARDARAAYRRARRAHEQRASSAQGELTYLEDKKGQLLKSCGGVNLYQRWIDTPQGDGSLIGVRTKVEADAHVVVAYSPSPQQASNGSASGSSSGNTYVVIEGPNVSGVAVCTGLAASPTSAGESPMQQALGFSAEVNNAARGAEKAAPQLAGRIEAARQKLETANDDDNTVERARQLYTQAVGRVPARYRGEFRDAQT